MKRVVAMLAAAFLGLVPGARAAVPADAWNLYRQKFVTAEGRVVDDVNGGISHSESQGYGLLLACLAGDRATFASIFAFTRTELLLVILGGLLVIEVGSVILQTSYFKLTRRMTGTPRRLFKMTPFHHHFELLGWAQVTIVMRFWIICGLCVAAGLGIFYAEWVSGT